MTELAKVEQAPPPVVQDMTAGLLSVIERAARDPSVDIDKMERLFAMQERLVEREAKNRFTAAKIAMRPHLPAIDQRGRIVLREKLANGKRDGDIIQDTPFARFEDIHAAVEPILIEHGFDLSFRNGTAPDGKVRVTTILTHETGHSEETYFDLPHDSSGSKNAVQAIGSSTSYAKRYGLVSILNLRIAGEDDDAVKGGAPSTVTDDQLDKLETKIGEVGADRGRFMKLMKVSSLADIPQSQFDVAMVALDAKKKAAQ